MNIKNVVPFKIFLGAKWACKSCKSFSTEGKFQYKWSKGSKDMGLV